MRILALILGILGGLSAAMGVLDAAEVTPDIGAGFTTMFWLILGMALLLGCIASIVSRETYD
jgi:hypothetical protein